MTPERYQQVSALFDRVVRCEPGRRQSLLAEACARDRDLCAEVERMLAADSNASRESFLDVPTDVVAPSRPITEGPGDRVGPYKILQPLGEGGMGAVFLAEQGEPVRRRVALKLIKPGMDSAQVIARFSAERQALAILDHPHIAKVFDAGTTESGRPYFVMELVRGVPITEYCDRNRLTPRQRLALFIPVCRAIQHAHQKGIIHRDIKPSNVLVTLVDGQPVPKVIDFGVAKAIDQRLTEQTIFTQMGIAVGTLEYMSPEQADLSALDVDTRSDVYALGVLLYELLTGSTPLERARLRQAAYAEIVRRIQEEEPPKPSTRLSNSGDRLASIAACRGEDPARLSKLVRGELDWIAMKALEKDRTRRYETANGLARDIERYLEGAVVEAGPPTARYQLSKFARRHSAALAITGAFALVLVGATVLSAYLAIRAGAAEKLANGRLEQMTAAEAEKSRALDETRVAQAKTELALKESEQSRAQAEGVSAYLVESFRKPDPSQDGRTLKVVDLLDQAVAGLDRQFTGSPLVRAMLLHALGQTYLGLGLPDPAIGVHAKALAILAAARGGDYEDTIKCRSNLASAYQAAGRLTEAIALHEHNLQILEARLGRDHDETLVCRNNLAQCYLDAGRVAEALAIHEHNLKVREAQLGHDHESTLISRSNLAAAFRRTGRVAEAIALLQELIKYSEAKRGRDHPRTLTIRNNLASCYGAIGRYDEAIALDQLNLSLRESKLGQDHPETLISRDNLAGYYRNVGRIDDAIRMIEQNLALYEAKLGQDHPDTLLCRNNLAVSYVKARRTADSIPIHQLNARLAEAKLGAGHPTTRLIRRNLANSYMLIGDWARSETLNRTVLSHEESMPRGNDVTIPGLLAELGYVLVKQQKYAEAEPFLKRCLAERIKSKPDDWSTYNTMSLLGESLLGQKKFAAAEPLLADGFTGIKRREASIPPRSRIRVVHAALRIVALYEAWGKPGDAVLGQARLELPPATLPADVFGPPG